MSRQNRKGQRQAWVDENLVLRLKRIKLERQLMGMPNQSIYEVSKEVESHALFSEIEKDLIKNEKKDRIRFDKKRVW